MANTCDNDLTITGSEEAIAALSAWIEKQTHAQAPNERWAALYNLETESDGFEGIGFVGSGSADHAYGCADYSTTKGSAYFQWASKNNPSLDVVMTLAKKFPELSFAFSYRESGQGLHGTLSCANGEVLDYEGGYDSEDWDSEEESDEAPI